MATTGYFPSLISRATFPACDEPVQCEPLPVCPTCGGLHTLCRPRFFAGQLLSEEDLNRLDRYMTEKNRLHNRHIHGSGVACGLEVTCTVCSTENDRGKVIVKPGYALSPCGNDIVVPKAETVDICTLIQRCRPPEDECFSPSYEENCEDAEEDWILAVCYKEQTAREMVALRATSNCTEGKHAAGPCGCSGKTGASTTKQSVANGVNVSRAPQCEPTVTCETYCFRAYKIPTPTNRQQQMGAIVKRFVCCIVPYFEELGGFPTDPETLESVQWQQWMINLKEVLRKFLRREGLYDCEVAQKLNEIGMPTIVQINNDGLSGVVLTTIDLLTVAVRVVQKCLCGALLPPCPDPALDDCVPIATVRVGRNPCRVIEICNLSSRSFLLTWPNIYYWLSWSSANNLRDFLKQLCCTDTYKEQLSGILSQMMQTTATVKKSTSTKTTSKQSVFSSLLLSATEREVSADLGTLLLAAMGASDANGYPLASETELRNPGEFILINQLVVPMLKTMLPQFGAGTSASTDIAKEVVELRKKMEALSKRVKTQATTINSLKKKINK